MEERRVTISCNAQKLGEVLQKLNLSDKFKDTEMEVTLNILDCKENYETLVKSGISWDFDRIPEKKEAKPKSSTKGDADRESYSDFGDLDLKNPVEILSFLLGFVHLKNTVLPKEFNLSTEVIRRLIRQAVEDRKTYSDRSTTLLGTLPEKLRVVLNSNIIKIVYPRHHLSQCLLHSAEDMTVQNLLEMFVKFYA